MMNLSTNLLTLNFPHSVTNTIYLIKLSITTKENTLHFLKKIILFFQFEYTVQVQDLRRMLTFILNHTLHDEYLDSDRNRIVFYLNGHVYNRFQRDMTMLAQFILPLHVAFYLTRMGRLCFIFSRADETAPDWLPINKYCLTACTYNHTDFHDQRHFH